MEQIRPVDLRFHHPARIIVYGLSNSAKTTLVVTNLLNAAYFRDPITKVVWYYGHEQPGYRRMAERGIVLREGLPEDLEHDFPGHTPEGQTRILVLDDLMKEAANNEGVLDIFTAKSYHKNITAIMLTQNLCFQGKHSVNISRNASCIIFLIERRNMRVIRNFLQRCYESKQVDEIMAWIRRETYGKPYSSFMIDIDVKTPEDLQLRLNVIPSPEHGPTQTFSFPPPTPKWTYKSKVPGALYSFTMRTKTGPTPLLRKHRHFLERFHHDPDSSIHTAGTAQLRALQDVLQNVKIGAVPVPTDLINGTPRSTIGKGLETACCIRTRPKRLRTLLRGNKATNYVPLAAIIQAVLPHIFDTFFTPSWAKVRSCTPCHPLSYRPRGSTEWIKPPTNVISTPRPRVNDCITYWWIPILRPSKSVANSWKSWETLPIFNKQKNLAPNLHSRHPFPSRQWRHHPSHLPPVCRRPRKFAPKKNRTPVNQLQDLLHLDTAPVSRRTRSHQRGTGIQQYVSFHPVASKRCIHVPL